MLLDGDGAEEYSDDGNQTTNSNSGDKLRGLASRSRQLHLCSQLDAQHPQRLLCIIHHRLRSRGPYQSALVDLHAGSSWV